MKDSLKEKALNGMTLGVLLLIVVVGLVRLYPIYRGCVTLKRQNAELQEQIDQKNRKIERLVENQRRFRTDPDFIELIARQSRRVFPGELVFIYGGE